MYILYVRQRCVRGLVLVASRFPFVYVDIYTNGNLDDNETKPRTRRCRTYSTLDRDRYYVVLLGPELCVCHKAM